jgi:hypothetical protein
MPGAANSGPRPVKPNAHPEPSLKLDSCVTSSDVTETLRHPDSALEPRETRVQPLLREEKREGKAFVRQMRCRTSTGNLKELTSRVAVECDQPVARM